MEELPGKRTESRKFIYEGYAYHSDHTNPNNNVYRCATRSSTLCRGTVLAEAEQIRVIQPHHGHPPNPLILDEARMKLKILQFCRETVLSFDEIFRNVSLEYPQVAVNVTLKSMRSSMKRERSRMHPKTPETLAELGLTLHNYPVTQPIFRGIARGADGSVGLVFAHMSMLLRLGLAVQLFIDATFRVVPRKPKALQLLIIHLRSMDVAFPVVYVLCSRKTTQMYIAVWEFILNLSPGLRVTLRCVVSDFERAIINSVRQVFPGVLIRGFWFHYCQALYKKWRQLGLRRAPRQSLWMAMSMPLAPAARFEEALDAAAAVGNEIANECPSVVPFFLYVRRQWSRLADVVSVEQGWMRTNNVCETFHRHLTGRLGGIHPTIWIFLDRLEKLTKIEEMNWQRVQSDRPITLGRVREQVEEDARILDLQQQLSRGGLTVAQFLQEIIDRRHQVEIEAAYDDEG